MSDKHYFSIPIGDWSDDGHGKCEYFKIESSHSLQDVREAYFAAVEKHRHIWPEFICCEYEEPSVSPQYVDELRELGFEFKGWHEDDDECVYPTREDMVALVCWFIREGNPDIQLRMIGSPDMLPFYGYDDKKRHIGGFGYGLFCV